MYFSQYLADTDITDIQSSRYQYQYLYGHYRYPDCRYRYISIGISQIYRSNSIENHRNLFPDVNVVKTNLFFKRKKFWNRQPCRDFQPYPLLENMVKKLVGVFFHPILYFGSWLYSMCCCIEPVLSWIYSLSCISLSLHNNKTDIWLCYPDRQSSGLRLIFVTIYRQSGWKYLVR